MMQLSERGFRKISLNDAVADEHLRANVERRFRAKVDQRSERDCWLWTSKAKHMFGYGAFTICWRERFSALMSGPRNPRFGKRPPEHQLAAAKAAVRRGFKHSEETKQKMREAAYRRMQQ